MKYPQLVSMPSEISDWLEEQLEARGIDAVVYTRYILSLLHRDPVDVICPDQDLHFTQSNKEVRRSGSGRKRFRCFSQWRDHAQVDAEQLKRSAAIECLMSASDQNCGIESLVDELCEKLKEIKNNAAVNTEPTASSKSADQTVSPQDLAKQYYAAFPPLSQHRPSGTTLIPKWFSSPKKKGARKQNRSASFDEKLHYKVDTDSMKSRNCGKQRLGYFSRSRNDLGYSRSMAKSVERCESMTDWDLFMFSNNTKNKLSTSNTNVEMFGNIVEEKATSTQNVDRTEKQTKSDDNNKGLWNNEESMNICDDLPVDILELLDSPSPQDYTVEMMNLANMRDAGNKNFIQCGTNITSSIWSVDADDTVMFDNTYNTALDADQSEALLGIKFKSLTVGNKSLESIWSNPDVAENETNLLYENYRKSSFLNLVNDNCFGNNNFLDNSWNASGIEKLEKWSDAEYFDNEAYLRLVAKSFVKLNHCKEESSFIEVIPRSNSNAFNFFTRNPSNMVHMLNYSGPNKTETTDKDDDNLLTSVRSHFRPINAANRSTDNRVQKRYADGTSFVISATLDNPNYKRSESGYEYLESDCGEPPKKLLEFKNKSEKAKSALILKFFIRQNDKACQTDKDLDIKDYEMDNSQEVPCKKRVMSEPEEFFFPGDEEFLVDESKQCTCSCPPNTNKSATNMAFSLGNDSVTCPLHLTRPDSMLAEMWKGETKQCDKCSSNNSTTTATTSTTWNNGNSIKKGSANSMWQLDKESVQSIWDGEVCSACLGLNGGGLPPLPSSQQSRLREDISQDGEQLLSDLSTLQKSYMEQLPATEISYDISELIAGSNKERKRRHSPIMEAAKNAVPVHRGSWSIGSHLKQDRFMQVTSIPVLHSVTL